MKLLHSITWAFGIFLGMATVSSWAGSVDLGVGLGFVKTADGDGFEGGWDLIGGYEGDAGEDWNIGGQLHLIRGWTSASKFNDYPSDGTMYFQSTALLATARPRHDWWKWLQFKAGLVNANFRTLAMEGGGTGSALGVGVVVGGDSFRLHLLDVEMYSIGGHRFTAYSISFGVLFH